MPPDAKDPAIAMYEAHADTLLQRYDAVATMDILSPVLDLLPPHAPVLDIGAGSGRDAAWLVSHGHPVTAVEPVAGFRAAIVSRVPDATVVDARLPDLDGVVGPFGLILTNAVWHHLTGAQRSASIARLSGLLAPNGRLVLSLRHGGTPEGQPVHAVDPEAEIARAVLAELKLLRRATAPSHQPGNIAAGITWTWLVFEKEA
ncbi:MAG: class I SAM-dependent methyltransferase [Paracoccaceae bacterium]